MGPYSHSNKRYTSLRVARSLFCQGVMKQAWAWSVTLLLNNDGQVHIQVDATVEMIGAGGVEWSNRYTLTG